MTMLNSQPALSKQDIARLVWSHPWHYLSCGFGSGLLPRMPGTWGSMVAIPFCYILNQLDWWQYAIMLLFAFAIGIFLCGFSERAFRQKDSSSIVWDEIVGMWITLYLVPYNIKLIIIGFILFRLLDIFKPWPINWLQRCSPGGLGIMIDDAMAGIIAWGLLQLIILIM